MICLSQQMTMKDGITLGSQKVIGVKALEGQIFTFVPDIKF